MSQEEDDNMSIEEEKKEKKRYLITKQDFKQLACRYDFSKTSKECYKMFNEMLLSTMNEQVAASMIKSDCEGLKGLNQRHAEHGIKIAREYPKVFHK